MDSIELEPRATSLKSYLLSLADSAKHVSVGVGKDALHVYTKRKFKFTVPKTWDGVQVLHHKKASKPQLWKRISYREAS